MPLRRALAMLAVAAFGAAAQQVEARFTPEVERQAAVLFTEIMSPYCPGMTLTTCPSPGAAVMKDSIRQVLAEGKSPREVMQGLEAAYGPEIRARPPAAGFALLAWVGPFALLGLGGIGLTWWLRRANARHPVPVTSSASGPAISDVDRARLEAALRDDS